MRHRSNPASHTGLQAPLAAALILLASAPAAAAPVGPAMGLPAMPHHITVLGMFMGADWVVKTVLLGLLAASVACWTVFVAKSRALKHSAAAYARARDAMNNARSLEALRNTPEAASPLLEAALTELRLSSDVLHDADSVKERIATRFGRIEAEAARSMTKGIPLLATVGATAPFVGLFGTVWGIMNSFVGIAEKQTTNLAVVAPGIAEALLATAVGLVAAIPAVVIYNHLSRVVASNRAMVGDVSAAIINLVSRDLARGTAVKAAGYLQAAE